MLTAMLSITTAKALRAAMLVEQTRARERDREARAQAMAARNAEILEGLDRFRGIHLDPNRSHWDEVRTALISAALTAPLTR